MNPFAWMLRCWTHINLGAILALVFWIVLQGGGR